MSIKFTVLGFLIYAAMGGYLLAFILTLLKKKQSGKILYLIGFIFVVVCFVYRWLETGHPPMQGLLDIFLCMGLIYPFSFFCRRFLKVGVESADMLIGAIVLFPAGFIFSSQQTPLPPALQSWLFVPHVAVYMLAYIIMAKASAQAVLQFTGREPNSEGLLSYEQGTYRLVRMAFVPLTLGLLLGSFWGKLAWGDYWNWDPKEIWSLVTWLIYVLYFHFRYLYGFRYPRINSLLVLSGQMCIIITLLWVNLARIFAGLHNYTS